MITPLKMTMSVAALAAMSCAGIATASINYGDFSGTTVTYLGVTETANSPGDTEPLFGIPSISGDSLDFDPAGFSSASTGGGIDLTDGQLNFSIETGDADGLISFSVTESGDYSFAGVTPTAGTFVSASVSAAVTILEVDGVTLGTPINLFASTTFTTDYPTTGGAPSTGLLPWSAVSFIDLSSVLGAGQAATSIEVVIDNQLVAGSESGTSAFIAKKDFGITTVSIPEPGSLALLGLGGLLIARRRRSA